MFARDALNARSTGAASDTLVLLHGLGTDQTIWDGYRPWLSSYYRVLTYDLPFASGADPAFFDLRRHGELDGHAYDLLEILRAEKVASCSFIGHSVGGLIGIFAAIERPELFERLILLGASACYLNENGYNGGLDVADIDGMFTAVAENFRDWAVSFAPIATARPLEDPASQTFLASLLRTRPDIAVAMMRPILLGDHRDQIRKCKTPAVILQTEDDYAVPMDAALSLQQCLRGSRLEVIKTVGHLPHLSAPDAVADAFRRHLPRLPGFLHQAGSAS
jgi:pimeloyl-ACP methyl ester carboxylesterase